MANVEAKFRTICTTADNLQIYGSELGRQISRVENIKNNLSFKVKRQAGINASLNSVITNLSRERIQISQLKNNLVEISNTYMHTEKDVYSKFSKCIKTDLFRVASGTKVDAFSENDIKKWALKFLAEAGISGTIASQILGLITADKSSNKDIIKAVLEFAKGGNSAWGKLLSASEKIAQSGGKANWGQYILGLNLEKNKSFSESFMKELEKYKIKDAKGVSKWLGGLLSLGINGVENYGEFGGITTRGVMETILETGVDIGKSIVFTAASSALIGGAATALGFASAPAVLIGAGAVGIAWGADWVSKKLWGKDFTEAFSDGILDFPSKVGDIAKSAGKTIDKASKAISNAGKAAGKAAKGAIESLKNISTGWRRAVFG